MKTIEQLKAFYDTVLVKDLYVLEEKRRRLVNTFLVTAGIVGILALGGLVIGAQAGGSALIVFIPPGLGILIGGIVYGIQRKDYAGDFKSRIIRGLVGFLDPGLTYSEHGCIAESDYMASKIFTQRPDRYTGDDYVCGRIGATSIEFSELHSEYKTTSTDSKGRTQTHWHTIFKGLFFIADFNKHFNCEVVVLPDTAERFFGRFGQKLQALNFFRGQLIKLEDPEFERFFVVYGSDQIQARYILSTSLMQRITRFAQKTGQTVYLSFGGSRVHVAISYRKNLFEPRIFSTMLDFGPVREYYEDLQVAVGIVDDLNLNTRIWTKQ
ncbi:MAG TPA: DUF3137 domain-containing protein [Anaerohalosphaeraceae bacterium]|jgi:hypothetical protein|nr:DUF3137 domain-containing protein [Anaerohalosphaeraceae bacterium]HRT50853.1 DUF3137 domain-containing protein [Anaerohalosphaeraceae bacterium]HRT86709.1 DUF3137 domain-containing protein [Anaerohalosphaeraceae bacterium]